MYDSVEGYWKLLRTKLNSGVLETRRIDFAKNLKSYLGQKKDSDAHEDSLAHIGFAL